MRALPTSAFCFDVVPGTFILRIRMSTRSVVPAEREAAKKKYELSITTDNNLYKSFYSDL